MSIFSVFEVIGESIERLRDQKNTLERENKQLWESRDHLLERLHVTEKERDELKAKLNAVQDYADSLAADCEKASMSEKTKESGC